MDPSHFVVGGLTAVTVALLVWIEIRSRRNVAAEKKQASTAEGGDVSAQQKTL